jgi:hypothetical protein
LRPDAAAAGEDPRRAVAEVTEIVVVRPTHNGGVAVAGQRDGEALVGSERAGADQIVALLGPHAVAAGVDQRTAAGRTYDGGVAVGRQ